MIIVFFFSGFPSSGRQYEKYLFDFGLSDKENMSIVIFDKASIPYG